MRADAIWLLVVALKAGLLLALAAGGVVMLRRAAPAARHRAWTLGVAGALLMPALCALLPTLPLAGVPAAFGARPELHGTAIAIGGAPTQVASPAWPSWLLGIWAAGTLAVALRLLVGMGRARRLARTTLPFAADDLRALGATPVDVRSGDAITSPMTVGVWRPRVLLPTAAASWPADRRRVVLLHELGHVQRRDVLVQVGAQLACALYWWNPLTWLAAARLRVEREHACDDLVLAAGVRPSTYAAELLAVARSGAAPRTAAAVADMATGALIAQRVHRILDAATVRRRRPRWARASAATLALLATAAVACTTAAPSLPAPGALAAIAPVRGTIAIGPPRATDQSRAAFDYRPAAGRALPADDLAIIADDLTVRLSDLQRCYEDRLAERPTLAGEISIHWVIQHDGSVPEHCISHDTVGDPAIAACVNQLIRDTTFTPPVAGEVGVEFPFVFAPQR